MVTRRGAPFHQSKGSSAHTEGSMTAESCLLTVPLCSVPLGTPLASPPLLPPPPQGYPSPQGHCFGCCAAPFPIRPNFPTACSGAWPCPSLSMAPWVWLGAEECASPSPGSLCPNKWPWGGRSWCQGRLAQRQTVWLSPPRQTFVLSPPR